MAVTYDNSSSAQTTAASTLAFNHTPVGSSDLAVFVGVESAAAVPELTTSVTYGGTAMTELWDSTYQSFHHGSGHALAAASLTGLKSVSITVAGAQDELAGGVISMLGVDQTTPTNTVPTVATGASTVATSPTIPSKLGELVCFHMANGWAGASVGGSETERWEQIVSSSTTSWGATVPGSSNVVCVANRTAAGNDTGWGINGVSFRSSTVSPTGLNPDYRTLPITKLSDPWRTFKRYP